MCLITAAVAGTAVAAATANMAIMAVITTGIQMQQQRANAKSMERAGKQRQAEQKQINDANAMSQYAAIADADREKEIAMSAKKRANQLKADEARAFAVSQAGETGVKGQSVGLMLDDLDKQDSAFVTALDQQEMFQNAQFIRQGERIRAGHQAGYLAAVPDPVPQPNYLQGIVNIGSTALGTYIDAGGTFGED